MIKIWRIIFGSDFGGELMKSKRIRIESIIVFVKQPIVDILIHNVFFQKPKYLCLKLYIWSHLTSKNFPVLMLKFIFSSLFHQWIIIIKIIYLSAPPNYFQFVCSEHPLLKSLLYFWNSIDNNFWCLINCEWKDVIKPTFY